MLLDNSNYRFGSKMYTNKFNTDPQSAGYSDHMMAWSAAWVLCIQGQCAIFFQFYHLLLELQGKQAPKRQTQFPHTWGMFVKFFFRLVFSYIKYSLLFWNLKKNLCASEKTKPCIKKKTSAIQNRQPTQTYQTAKQRSFWSLFSLWKRTMLNNNKNQSTDVNYKNVQWSVHGDMQIYVALLSLLQTQIHRHTDIHTLRSMFSIIFTDTDKHPHACSCTADSM